MMQIKFEKKPYVPLYLALFLLPFLLLMPSFVWAQAQDAPADNGSVTDEVAGSAPWTTAEITGAWEVVSRVYLTLPDEETIDPDFRAEIEAVNASLAGKRIIERFSDEVYNHFDAEQGGENIIYDKSADALFVYETGDPEIYQFTFEQYQDDFLEDGGHDSYWDHVETLTQAQPPVLGLEVEQIRYWSEEDSDGIRSQVRYWVSSELPAWFYGLKGLGLPGYALKQSSSLAMEGYQVHVNKEALTVRPVDPAALLRAPEEDVNVIPWETEHEDDKAEASLSERAHQQADFLKALVASNPERYEAVSVFQGGLARVEQAGQSFYINTQAERLFDQIVDTILTADSAGCYELNPFDEGVMAYYLVARNNKMGLVDPHTGQWLIEADYDYLEKRPCQILRTHRDGRVGLLTATGKELVPTEYEQVHSFGFQQFFAVQQEGQWGIYEGGRQALVMPAEFEQIDYCGGCGSKPDYFYAKKGGYWGLVGFDGQQRLPFEYEFPQHSYMRGDQWVMNLQRDGKQLLIHLETGAHYLTEDYEDLLVLNDFVAFKKEGRFALFNGAGAQLTDFELTGVYELDRYSGQKPFIVVAKAGLLALLDASGTEVVPWQQAEHISRLRQDYFVVYQDQAGPAELRDLNGTVLVPAHYDAYRMETRKDASNEWVDTEVLKVDKGGLRGWYFATEGALVEPVFDDIRHWMPEQAEQPYILVTKDGLDGLYTLQGSELIPPAYESLELLQPDLLSFRRNGGYGLMDLRTAKELVAPHYAAIDSFKTGQILRLRRPYEQLQEGESPYHWWDTLLQEYIELPFEFYEPLTEAGLWQVLQEGKSFLYDAVDRQIISGPYDFIGAADHELIIVGKDHLFGVINDKGETIYPVLYDMALQNEVGFVALSQQNEQDFWDTWYVRPDGEPVLSAPMRTWDSPDFHEAPWVRADGQELVVSAYVPQERGDRFGIYDWQGKERLAPVYETLFLYDDAPGYGVITKGRLGLLDDQGNELLPAILDGVYHVEAQMHWGLIRQQAAGFPLLAYIDAPMEGGKQRYYFYVTENAAVLPLIAARLIEFE